MKYLYKQYVLNDIIASLSRTCFLIILYWILGKVGASHSDFEINELLF